MTREEAERLAETLYFAGEHVALIAFVAYGRIHFTGGSKGEHSLAIDVSSERRVRAHWEGYCAANGVEWDWRW